MSATGNVELLYPKSPETAVTMLGPRIAPKASSNDQSKAIVEALPDEISASTGRLQPATVQEVLRPIPKLKGATYQNVLLVPQKAAGPNMHARRGRLQSSEAVAIVCRPCQRLQAATKSPMHPPHKLPRNPPATMAELKIPAEASDIPEY
mmetsp:Transcript_31294/g.61422  ORF Transcript_31294/g.61422 Transcript_31294/m.61422 type:complete len:150 (-) Transcript_31294:801-1250(-)